MQHIYNQPQFGEDWFTYPKLYSDMVKLFPSGSKFVEIGSWKGKSTSYMAVEIVNSGKQIEFYCIDTFEGNAEHQNNPELPQLYEIFKSNMKPVEGFYTDMKMTSMEAVKKFEDESLDFVFIDGSHKYQDIKDDITCWLPKVKRGGVLAGHDYYPPPLPPTWSARPVMNSMEMLHYNQSDASSAYRAVGETLGHQNIIADQDCYIYQKK